jgi:hypothetical protein
MKAPLWPPPNPIKRLLHRAYRRYWEKPPEERPSLADPTSYMCLFDRYVRIERAKAGYAELPPEALQWLAISPEERARRKRRQRRAIARVARKMMADVLPDAVQYLSRRKKQ